MNGFRKNDEIPGTDVIRELVDDIKNLAIVDHPVPIDITYITDSGMRAVVALAASLEWNVLKRNDAPTTIVARNGYRTQIPTDTSIKFNVFRAKVHAVFTHSITAEPTAGLIERLIKQYKLDPSHAQVIRKAFAAGRPAAPQEETPVEEPFVPTERVEETLSQGTKNTWYVSPLMDTVIRQLVADGSEQITYRCKICGLEFETKRGVGGHYQVHIKAGEATATVNLPRTYVKPTPVATADTVVERPEPTPDSTSEPEPVEPEPTLNEAIEPPTERTFINNKPLVDELLELRRIVSEVGRLVGREQILQLQERCQELTIERDEAVTRANRLASDLRSLRELIGGLSDE